MIRAQTSFWLVVWFSACSNALPYYEEWAEERTINESPVVSEEANQADDASIALDVSTVDNAFEVLVEEDPPLPCDPGFFFVPDPFSTSKLIEVHFRTTVKGYAYVGLEVTGPGNVKKTGMKLLSGTSPWEWMWFVTVDQGGVYTFTFTAEDPKQNIASCQKRIEYTGAPPGLPQDCEGKFCGDPDGIGGRCGEAPCRLVGAFGGQCLDPPSPIHPNGTCSPWSCLDDSRQCANNGDHCKVWCPFEKCLRPEGGCPQYTEACWIDPNETDYENACRWCCINYNSYWDEALNICRDSDPAYRGDPAHPIAPNGDSC